MIRILILISAILFSGSSFAGIVCRGEYVDTKGKGPTGDLILLEESGEHAIYEALINKWKYRAELNKQTQALKILIYFNNMNAPSLYTATTAPSKDQPLYTFTLLFGYKLGINCAAAPNQ